jgi:hypothetical protein
MEEEMKKQTAVEWLKDWMGKNQYFIGNDLLEAIEQAKAMEKEQIMEAYKHNSMIRTVSKAEQYYNETYGGDK